VRGKHLNSGIRGGLWEVQHLQRMGRAVWLFGWLVHRQTREREGVGLVLGGSPLTYQIMSEDTGMAIRTLKRWMACLVRFGYVQVTHTVHKRMVIRIAKAKKFGPQQLRFPQTAPTFPQVFLFAPKSKGPLPAFEHCPKGPILAPMAAPQKQQAPSPSVTYVQCADAHREFKSERQTTKPVPRNPFIKVPGQTNRPDLIRYGPDRKALRELEVRAELRVGAGPVIQRE
jgi:hypothetical protein